MKSSAVFAYVLIALASLNKANAGPIADGFEYEIFGGATFTSITLPSAVQGFGTVDVEVSNVVLATITSDDGVDGGIDTYTFGPGISVFSLTGLDMPLDTQDPGFVTAFPLFIDFSGRATELRQTPILVSDEPDLPSSVPTPSGIYLLVSGLALLFTRRRPIHESDAAGS